MNSENVLTTADLAKADIAKTNPAEAKPDGNGAALLRTEDATQLHGRWAEIQTAFVDEPRNAVERADTLVAEVMKRVAEGFANERASLEQQWDRGDQVTTEDLRVALQKYRSFFDRLLNVTNQPGKGPRGRERADEDENRARSAMAEHPNELQEHSLPGTNQAGKG